jgi:hypothetical protein
MNLHKSLRETPPYTGLLRVFGVLVTLAGLGFYWLVFAINEGARGLANLHILLVPATFFIIIGIGTFYLSRALTIILSILCAAVGLWLIVGSIFYVPFPWFLINVLLGSACLIPLYALIQIYRIDKRQMQTEQGAAANP